MSLTHITGGRFQDVAGHPIANGYIEFRPSGDEQGSGPLSQLCGGITVKVPLDASGNVNPPAPIWATDTSTPSNSFYAVTVFTSKGQRVYAQNVQIPSSPDPFDLSFVVPWNPATISTGGGDGHAPQIFAGTYLGWTLTGFQFDIPTPGVLGFTLGAGTAVGPSGRYIQAAQLTKTDLEVNKIYDLWLQDSGEYLIAERDSDDYTNAPLYPNLLHIVRVQTGISPYNGQPSVNGIFTSCANWPIEKQYVEQSLNLKDFVTQFFWIPTNAPEWQPNTEYATGDIFVTPVGRRIYQCNLPGTSGSTEPTATYGNPQNNFLIQDGTEYCAFFGAEWAAGSMRWAKNNGIEQYFQNLGLRLVCKWLTNYPNPTDGVPTDMILSHIKKQFYTIAHIRQDSFDYGRGQIIIVPQGSGGFYWQCTTAGASASSSPFSGSYSIGSTVTDGTAVFKAVYNYNNQDNLGADWLWLDWLQDFETAKYPDSTDSYASTFATLIATYIQQTGNISWLSETSPQAGLTYYEVLKNIVEFNLTDQMYSETIKLTNTFQNQLALFPPFTGTYNISYTEDNAESYEGLVSMASIANYMGDTAFATTCTQAAVDVANAMYQYFYGTANTGDSFFLYYYPPDPGYTHDSVAARPTGTLQYYPELQPTLWPEVCNVDFGKSTNDIRYSSRNFVIKKWVSYFADPGIDTGFSDLHLCVQACTQWKKLDIAQDLMRRVETLTIPKNASANLTIDEFGRYLFCKNQLLPYTALTSVDATGMVFNSDPLNNVTVPLPPSNNVVASGTYDATFGDFILAATADGDVTVNLPQAIDGTFAKKSPIFISKYGPSNTVTIQDTSTGFSRTLTNDGSAFTLQASSGVWVVISQVT